MARTRIKICGVRDLETALVSIEAGADAVGLVFAAQSPRVVDFETASGIASALPAFADAVGLFVDPSLEDVEAALDRVPLDAVQLHGDEDEGLVEAVANLGVRVIKAARFEEKASAALLERWNHMPALSALLLDGSPGGGGLSFDWRVLARLMDAAYHPIVVAGGLEPDNVAKAIRTIEPYAVDVSSGVERERGVKDHERIARFCLAVQLADLEL